MPDHEAIFISRKLHLGFIYCVALIAGCLVIYLYDIRALALIVPLLAFLSGPVFAFEATQSLPTAGAAILGFDVRAVRDDLCRSAAGAIPARVGRCTGGRGQF